MRQQDFRAPVQGVIVSKYATKVLFICPAASRSGAPLSLLHLLRRLLPDPSLDICLLLLNDGPLSSEFEKVCPLIRARQHKLGLRRRVLRERPDLIYANSVASGLILKRLAPLPCPVVTHIHEMEFALAVHGDHFAAIQSLSDRFIAVSQAVQTNLVERRGISSELIDIVYALYEPIASARTLEGESLSLRRGLGIDQQALIIGCVGSVEMRKGPDLFIQLAASLLRLRPNLDIHFIWVGHCADNALKMALAEDTRKAGLEGRVHFVGEQANPAGYYSIFDLLALMSREDPFPAVCLEAASIGKPILCFAEAGGIPEFVTKGAGVVVSFLDVAGVAEAALRLIDDADFRHSCGVRAAELSLGEFSPQSIVPQLRQVIGKSARSK